MKWLCSIKHNWHMWLGIDGYRRRVCRRCWREQRLDVWHDDQSWVDIR